MREPVRRVRLMAVSRWETQHRIERHFRSAWSWNRVAQGNAEAFGEFNGQDFALKIEPCGDEKVPEPEIAPYRCSLASPCSLGAQTGRQWPVRRAGYRRGSGAWCTKGAAPSSGRAGQDGRGCGAEGRARRCRRTRCEPVLGEHPQSMHVRSRHATGLPRRIVRRQGTDPQNQRLEEQ